jgi:hypothetical protein
MKRQSLISMVGIINRWLESCKAERETAGEVGDETRKAMLAGKCKAYTEAIVLLESRIDFCPHENAAKLALAGKPDLDKCEVARMQAFLTADVVRIEQLKTNLSRTREVAAFLAESIENPHMKTQQEALKTWKELNK